MALALRIWRFVVSIQVGMTAKEKDEPEVNEISTETERTGTHRRVVGFQPNED